MRDMVVVVEHTTGMSKDRPCTIYIIYATRWRMRTRPQFTQEGVWDMELRLLLVVSLLWCSGQIIKG